MKTLETPRLVLRAFRETDADDVFAYAKNPKVGPAAGWKPHADREESLRIVRMFIAQDEVWAIEDRESGRVIGSIGLHRDRKRDHPGARMVGYVLAEAYWGRGLAVEAVRALQRHAFEGMGLDILSVVHFPFNAQSRRVIEKCGFTYEGTLRRATPVFSGEIYDDVCYSMTREEWEAQEDIRDN